MTRAPRLLSIFGLLLLLTSCGASTPSAQEPQPAEPPRIAFDTARIRLTTSAGSRELRVEVASTNDQHMQGLMDRPSLAPDAGMLFLYPDDQSPGQGFWMYRTLIPLDIAYLDAEGRILVILTMPACTSQNSSDCPGFPPGVPYRATLEVNEGYFARNGIRVGDRVALPPRPAGP